MGLQDDMKTLLAMDAQAQKETFTPSHHFTPDVAGTMLRRRQPSRQRSGHSQGGHMADRQPRRSLQQPHLDNSLRLRSQLLQKRVLQ